MPETKPDLVFDDSGECSACRAAKYKEQINWEERKEEFKRILSQYKGKGKSKYDCIVPISGGKDSTFQVYMVKKVHGMNPLCVHFEPTAPSVLGRKNLDNIRKLGVDIISFKPNPAVYDKLCKKAFFEVGDHEWPNHAGIFTVPIKVAVQYNIPLIIWGENPQLEYGGPGDSINKANLDEKWLHEFGGLLNVKTNQLLESGFTREEIEPYFYPSTNELKKVGVKGLFLGYYFKWDARKQVELIKHFGFNVSSTPIEGTYTNYENLDDLLVWVHDYFKYLKYGFGRTSDHTSLDIRNKRITREEAFALIARFDGKFFMDKVSLFCKRFDITREQFFETVEKFANKNIFACDENGKLIWRDGNLVNVEFEDEIKRSGYNTDRDISEILIKIEDKVKEDIEKNGYVYKSISQVF